MVALDDHLDELVWEHRQYVSRIARHFHTIKDQIYKTTAKFPPFNSAHEGYAVLREEVDELWEAIKKKDKDHGAIQKEAIQVAAMALRFLEDVCEKRRP